MKILTGQRSSGTTTAMLLEANMFENSLVVVCTGSIDYYTKHAVINHLNIDNITFINWHEFIKGNYDKSKHWRIFIDNIDLGIKGLAYGSHIETITFSLEQMWNDERGNL